MLKRTIPFLALLALGGGGGAWFRSVTEPDRRYGRIDELLRSHQDRPSPAWTDADAEALWAHVTWFSRRDRAGFTARILRSLATGSSDEAQRAILLAAHVEHYSALYMGTPLDPWQLPRPDVRRASLLGFGLRRAVVSNPDALARLADEARASAVEALCSLAEASDAPVLRDAFIRLAFREPPNVQALFSLGRCAGDAVASGALDALAARGRIDHRLFAAAGRAAQSDPAGTRLFVELLSDPFNELSRRERGMAADFLTGRLPSLKPLWRGEVVAAAWRSWLEIREHEGFSPAAQEARDQAFLESTD